MPPVHAGTSNGAIAGTNIVQVTTTLPAGAPAVSTLTLTNSFASVKPGGTGAFSLPVSTEGPQYAELDDVNGKAVGVGFVGPQAPTVDATSTAKVLIFFAAGFYQIPSPYRSQLVDAVASEPGFPAVVSATSAAMAAGGVGSTAGAPMVSQALQTFVTAFYAPASQTASARTAKYFVRTPQDVLVSPSTQTSGITTINDFPDGVHFQNAYRRLATAFFDEVSPTMKRDVIPPVQIPAVNGFGNIAGTALTAVQAYNGGDGAYTPVSTPSTPLALDPASSDTTYAITVVGAGLPTGATLTASQSQAETLLVAQQLVQDYIVPIVCSILLPVADSRIDVLLSEPGANAALADLVNATVAVPMIISMFNNGDVGGALALDWNTLIGSNQLQNLAVAIATGAAAVGGASAAQITAYKAGTNLLTLLNIVSGSLVAIDIGVLKSEVLASHSGDTFTVDVRPDTLAFNPPTASIANNASQSFAITVLANTGEETPVPLSYSWSNTANYGYMGDGIDGHVNNFQSSQSSVVYTADATGTGTDTITVTVSTLASPGHPSVVIGTKTATVVVGAAVYSVSIMPYPCTQFPSTGNYTVTFTATETGPPLPAGHQFVYGWIELIDLPWTVTVPPPVVYLQSQYGSYLTGGLTPTASVTSAAYTGDITGSGVELGVYLFDYSADNGYKPLYEADGVTQANGITALAAGAETCAAYLGMSDHTRGTVVRHRDGSISHLKS